MTTVVEHHAPNVPRPAGAREWWGLAVLVLPTVLIALDMTVLHLVVPALSADLRPTSAQLLWILDIYGFMIAGFLITMGTLGDRIGRRRLLLSGATAFGAASVFAAFSTSAEMLIVTRALLGIAGATLMPSTLSLIRNMFQVDSERTFAIMVWTTGFIVGSAIGPLVGGVVLEFFWWGAVFLLAVPVMLFLLIVGPLLLPEFRDSNAGRMDLISATLCIGALLAAIYGLKEIARNGITPLALLTIAFGVVIGLRFVRRQQGLADPMFDLGLFANRDFSTSIAALLLTVLALSGAWLMIFQYLQGVLGMTALIAGLVMLPATLVQVIGAVLVPPLTRRLRRSTLIGSGLLVAVLGFLVMTQVAGAHALPLLLAGTVIMGVGVMPMMILGTDLVVSSAPPHKAGAASATSETAIELGMALGIAIIGSIGTAVYRREIANELSANGVPAAAMDTLGGALAVAGELPAAAAASLIAAAQAAFSTALHTNAAIGAIVLAATAVLIALFLRDRPVRPPRNAEADATQAAEAASKRVDGSDRTRREQ